MKSVGSILFVLFFACILAAAPGLPVYLEPGYFLMLYPGEAHHVLTGDGSPIVKVIIKIDIELLNSK